MFDKEFEFFKKSQDRLVQQYGGKILAIKDEEVIGVFDNMQAAYIAMEKQSMLGKVMIQPCIAGREAYTVSVTSVGVVG